MVKKMVVPSPEPEPTPAPARITVGEKILARMDEALEHVALQEKRLVGLESQIWAVAIQIRDLSAAIKRMDETVLAKMQEGINTTRNSAQAAEIAAEDAKKGMENLSEQMPDVEEVIHHIRSQERIEWLASLKPAF
jgi:methyl-accepting chemotaxis protein